MRLSYKRKLSMTNKEIMDIAMQQSAYDINAKVSDFLQDTNVFVKSELGPLARKYYKEPNRCRVSLSIFSSSLPM